MTRIGHQNLYAQNRTGIIAYDRNLEFLVLYNNNPVPLYIRLGSEEIPNELNYDIAVPPNYIMAISVNSNQFGFRLGSSAVVVSLITGVTVIEATIDEQPPSLGGVPINNASLATADLLNGILTFAAPTVYGPFNVNQWGGLIVNVLPTSTSGQGVIQIDVSSDGVTFTPYQTWAFWQNIPATILLPRVSQFVRITLAATTIIGEPAIAGKISIRGSLAEITVPTYTPQGTSISKPWAIATLGSQQFSFVTAGLPAVSITGIATAGTGAGAIVLLLVEASSDNVNWRQVTQRRQFMSQGITLYRSFGNLAQFLRVSVSELSGSNASNGILNVSIPSLPDTAAILNTIYQTLGDVNNPNPIGAYEDAYHELDAIRLSDASIDGKLTTTNADLASIDGKLTTTNADLASIDGRIVVSNTSLGTISTNTANTTSNTATTANNVATGNGLLTGISTSDAAIATSTASIDTKMNTLTTISGTLTSILNTLNTYQPNLPTIVTRLTTLTTLKSQITRPVTDTIVIGAIATWARGILAYNSGEYISTIQVSIQIAGAAIGSTQIFWGLGSAAAVTIGIYTAAFPATVWNAGPFHFGGVGPVLRYDGEHGVGVLVNGAGFLYNWVYCQNAIGTAVVNALAVT